MRLEAGGGFAPSSSGACPRLALAEGRGGLGDGAAMPERRGLVWEGKRKRKKGKGKKEKEKKACLEFFFPF